MEAKVAKNTPRTTNYLTRNRCDSKVFICYATLK